jgi:predicted lipoprotein
MIKKLSVYICLLLSFTFLTQCEKKKKDEEPAPESSFDKAGMLANYGDNLINPAYAEFKVSADTLKVHCDAFIAAPGVSTLDQLQASFLEASKKFQWVSTFEFGPAETELFRTNLNIFPCDTTEINTKIANANLDFSTVADLDVKGFPAMDFLLFGIQNDDNYIISKFSMDANAANRKNYLNAVVAEIKTRANTVYQAWTTGNYISTFKNSTGSDVGSSLSLLVNQLNQDLEVLKNARIGIPAGKRSLGVPLPDKCEAFYSGYSLTLAEEHLNNIENIYLGRSRQNVDGLGFDNYLDHIGAQFGSGTLNNAIKNKFSAAKAKLALVPDELADAVVNNATLVDAAYLELQQLVVLLKVDMASALGVSITYVDNDGD